MNKNKKENYTVEPQILPKIPTNISGLDEVLHGGLPEGRLTIVNGGPGAGKTILGMELIVKGIEQGRAAVFISFEETSEAMRRNAISMGWDLAKMEEAGQLAMINPKVNYGAVSAGDYNIEGLFAILEGQARIINANFIVIDAIDILMNLFDNPKKARNQLVALHRWLSEREFTAVLTVKSTHSHKHEFAYLDFMADCVINMDQRVHEQITTRRLHVKKYRGSGFASRENPFVISENGIVVMPLSFVDLVQYSVGELVETDDKKLNAILGGGFRKGSSILISGPSGSGKTTLAFTITTPAAKRGDRVLFLSFEQSETAIISEMKSVGFDLKSLIDQKLLRITSVMPESLGMEEHLLRVFQEIEEYQPEHLVLDAISATKRIGSSQAAMEFLIRLYHFSKKRGVSCIFTNQTFSLMDKDIEISGHGISSLVDTAILLNYYRENNYLGHSLLVLKSRGTNHSNKYHQFRITDNGIAIEDSANK